MREKLLTANEYMAASSKGNSNTSTDALLDPKDHHPHRVLFAPQLEVQDYYHVSNPMAYNMINHSTPLPSSHPPIFNNDFMKRYGGGPYELTDFDQTSLFFSDVPETSVDPFEPSIVQDDQREDSGADVMRPPTLNIFPSQPMHAGHPSSTSKAKVSLVICAEDSGADVMRPPTLNIFPSQPMHAGHPSSTSKAKVSTATILFPSTHGSERPSELFNSNIISDPKRDAPLPLARSSKSNKHDRNKKALGSISGQDHPKTPDSKSLRRLAQNREAARKSRLRKKAYVQQLESSRIKLTQLEQELQKAKAKGVYLSGVAEVFGADQSLPQDAAAFDIEYAKWLEEHRQCLCRLQVAFEAHLSDNEIRICVENCIAHFDDLMHLKSMIVKFDVFHILSGMWKTPVERCFLWIGGFRPSELIKIIPAQIEPLTDHQIMGIIELQNSMFEAEEALSQVHERLNQSLLEAILSENLKSPTNVASYMGQMAGAMHKLSNLEDIVIQADKLRLQTIHRVHQLMTCRQAARSLMAIGEYFRRLLTLSSIWATRERQP